VSLSESLRLDAHRGSEMEDVRCVSNTNTLWSVRNEATLRDAMRRVRDREPFGWRLTVRRRRHEPAREATKRMTRAMEAWPTLPNLVVSVGEWWLCNGKYREIWKNSVEAIAALRDFTFHAGCFYLPMGAPDDDDLEMWAEKGIEGWARAALDANVTIALVGPRNLAGIPWLTARGWGVEDAATKRARFVDAAGVSDHATRMDAALKQIEAISVTDADEFGNGESGDRLGTGAVRFLRGARV